MKKIIGILLPLMLVTVGSVYADTLEEKNAAQYLAERGIINEYEFGSDSYELGRQVLRQEAVAIAREISAIPKKETCEGKFSDISETWVCQSAEAMLDAGRIAANDTFRPRSNLTKPEALAMLVTSACSVSYEEYKKAHPELVSGSTLILTLSTPGTWSMLHGFSEENNLLTEGYESDRKGLDLGKFLSTTRGEMFEIAEKVMKGCGEENIVEDLGDGFTVRNISGGEEGLFYNETSIHISEISNAVDIDNGYTLNEELSTERIKIFNQKRYLGDSIIYDLNFSTYATIRFGISKFEVGTSGVYVLSYGPNGISRLSMLTNNGVIKELYVGKADQANETTIIQDFELLENRQVKVTFSFPFQLVDGGTTNGWDGNQSEEKLTNSIIISVD